MRPSDDLDQVRAILRGVLPELAAEHGVRSLSVFGSVVRGRAGESSDVDLLVRFAGRPPSLFGFERLEARLEEILGRPVDLVMERALKPQLRQRILAEAVDVQPAA